jgi:hypothetical protein
MAWVANTDCPVTILHDARDILRQLPAGEGVHAGGRLVEEEFGAGRGGEREDEATLHALREPAELLVRLYTERFMRS